MESFEKSTDMRIIRTLKKDSPLTLQKISDKLGMSKMTVYKHVSRLEFLGFVRRRILRSEIGRPKYCFLLTEKGKDALHYPYDELFKDLVSFLVKSGNKDLIIEFCKDFFKMKTEEYRSRIPDVGDLDERLSRLLKMLSKDGYMPVLNTHEDGYEIEIENCPLRKLAELSHDICEIEAEMLRTVIGEALESLVIKKEESEKCKFLILRVLNKVKPTKAGIVT